MNPKSISPVIPTVLTLLLAACGGGGQAADTPTPEGTSDPEVEQQLASPTPQGPLPDTSDPSAGIRALGVSDGDCLDFTKSDVELVPCTGEWEYRVIGLFEVDLEGEYPRDGLEEQREPDLFETEAALQCDIRYTHYLPPTAESWRGGDRVVTCFQENFDLTATDRERLKDGAEILNRSCGLTSFCGGALNPSPPLPRGGFLLGRMAAVIGPRLQGGLAGNVQGPPDIRLFEVIGPNA